MSTPSHTSAVLIALREATREQHDQLDALSPLTSPGMSKSEYLLHASRVLGWMRPLERNLWSGPACAALPPELQAALRNVKVDWLVSDLSEGGMSSTEIENLPECPYTPVPQTLAECLGAAYVSEGATLGGAFLFKQLSPRMQDMPLHWLRGYGSETGRMWQTFLRILGRHVVKPDDILQAQQAAQQAFDSFRRWVIDESIASTR